MPSTTATDVYGLGAVLYSLITGRPPFQSESVLETIEDLRLRNPEPPGGTNRRVDRDLQTICLKCLEKQPEHRYRSAQDLADDLERWLLGKPIVARRVGFAESAWRWCRRNPRAALLMTAMAVLSLCATVGFAIAWNAREAVAEVNRGLRLRERVQRRKEYISDLRTVASLIDRNMVNEAIGLLEPHRPAPGAKDDRGFEHRRPDQDQRHCLLRRQSGHDLRIDDAVVGSPYGKDREVLGRRVRGTGTIFFHFRGQPLCLFQGSLLGTGKIVRCPSPGQE